MKGSSAIYFNYHGRQCLFFYNGMLSGGIHDSGLATIFPEFFGISRPAVFPYGNDRCFFSFHGQGEVNFRAKGVFPEFYIPAGEIKPKEVRLNE